MDEEEVCEIMNGRAEHRCKRCGNLMIQKLDNHICKECYKEMYQEKREEQEREELYEELGVTEDDE